MCFVVWLKMIQEINFIFIFCAVVTTGCENTALQIMYNDGDILEMHIEMNNIPSNFLGYQLQEYYYDSSYGFNDFVYFDDPNKDLNRKYQEVNPKTKILFMRSGVSGYYINFTHTYDGVRFNHEMKQIVGITPNQYRTSNNKAKHIINYSIKWNDLCVEFKYKRAEILSVSTEKAIVFLGQEYEQSCDEDGRFMKQLMHTKSNEKIWVWPNGKAKETPIRYRFTVQSFDDKSKLICSGACTKYIKMLFSKELEVHNTQMPSKDAETPILFKDQDSYEFSCQPNDDTSTVNWFLIDGNNHVKNVSQNYRDIRAKFTLTYNEFDEAKLVCSQYSCRYSKTESAIKTLECTREVLNVISFRRVVETDPKSTNTTLKHVKEVTTATTPMSSSSDETTEVASKETDNSSLSFVGIIIGVIVGILILLALATLLFFKVKKRRKVEDTPQEEFIYASPEIQYAVLEHSQRNNSEPPKNEEVLYSQVVGVLIPCTNA